jgi:hypothetical protein
MHRHPAYCLISVAILATALPAQPSLPLVDEVPFATLSERCEMLLKTLAERKAPLPAAVEKELKTLLRDGAKQPDAAEKIQKLLDAQCLCAVTINPESRVKAARGPATAELTRDRPTYVLIKVHNDAGVTAPMKISGPQLRGVGDKGETHWLEAAVHGEKLAGTKLEYVVVALTAHESGKREATLRFDVGQGTQDLGFRAEVPILFLVK